LVARSHEITFVTYGDDSDLRHAERVPGIRVLCNRWRIPARLYERLLPVLHARHLRRADLYKTNQTNGADVALRTARLWHKPLVARCGYMWSDTSAFWGEERREETARARRIEARVFRAAERVLVTTALMREYAVKEYALPATKVRVIPNYVETDRFSPDRSAPVPNRLCFVGQLGRLKNPLLLVEACAGLEAELVMVGDGPLRSEIGDLGRRLRVKVRLLGNRPHGELPAILRQATVFLLMSPHEGHPKALIEAMACGLPVIGANSQGIREIIRHGENGLLCEARPDSIRAAIQTLLGDSKLRQRMGRRAREFAVENFALDRIVKMEIEVLREVAGR
jgi:glycosyltransferase involved in cell wall biosynthesis